jgi:hypothetical protein
LRDFIQFRIHPPSYLRIRKTYGQSLASIFARFFHYMEGGEQYYVMHEKLRKIVEKKLSQSYSWLKSCFALCIIVALLETL